MQPRLLLLLSFLSSILSLPNNSTSHHCLNAGILSSEGQPRCHCPSGFIGEHCQLAAAQLASKMTSLQLTSNYSYLYYVPEEVNYYKLMFTICMHKNPSRKHTLFYIETERNDGSLREVPSLFQTAKIVLQENGCADFSTHYISIKRKEDHSFRRIVVGLKIMQDKESDKYLNTYFSHEQSSETVSVGEEGVDDGQQIQQVTIKMKYELYLHNSYYGTFMGLFTVLVLLVLLTSLITFFKKEYAIQEIDVDALSLTQLDLHYLARTVQRARRRNPLRTRNKIALSNLQLFMPIQRFKPSKTVQMATDGCHQMATDGCHQMATDGCHSDEEVCSICLLQFEEGEETRMTPCSHRYHRECIDNWWENNMSCPICRESLDFSVEMRQFYSQYLRNDTNYR